MLGNDTAGTTGNQDLVEMVVTYAVQVQVTFRLYRDEYDEYCNPPDGVSLNETKFSQREKAYGVALEQYINGLPRSKVVDVEVVEEED